MSVPKKYRNTEIPSNKANRPKNVKDQPLWMPPYEPSNWIALNNSSRNTGKTVYSMTGNVRRDAMNEQTIGKYTTDRLMWAGIDHYKDGTKTLTNYMERYGPHVCSGEYLNNYTSVVKYVAWALDLQGTANYTWRYKGKKR